MTKKNTNHSRKISPLSFSLVTKTEWQTVLSWRERGITKKVKEALMSEYLEWAELPTSLDFMVFLNDRAIEYKTFQYWYLADEDIKTVHYYVKQVIGARLQKRLYETNPEAVMKTIRKYHPIWEECWNEDAALKVKESSAGAGKVIVEMAPVENCPDVPSRPEGTD